MRSRRPLVFLSFLLVLAACSGPSQTTKDDGGPSPGDDAAADAEPEVSATLAAYETFDVARYPAEPPERSAEITHQVPGSLMQGRADEGSRQTVEGFRIQVFSARDQKSAQDFRERVRQWWEDAEEDAPSDLFRDTPPIIIQYSQPYYRVRIGAFADRERAEDALEFIRETYSGAFLAQSTVTVIR